MPRRCFRNVIPIIVFAHTALFPRATRHPAWRLRLCWLVLSVLLAAFPATAGIFPPRAKAAHASVLIIYDTLQQVPHPTSSDLAAPDSSQADALQLEQLLGHFPLSAQLLSLTEYRAGMLGEYPYVVYIGNVKNAVLPRHFLRDISHYRGTCYWINYGIGQLDSATLKRLGIDFQRLELEPGYTKVHYHGVELVKGDPTTNIIEVTAPKRCRLIADASAPQRASVPYITRSGNFWYVNDSPFSYVGDCDRYFAFADTLYDFFGIHPQTQKRAILRIEDVNVTDTPASLRDVADRLYRLHIPFGIAAIPHYRNPLAQEPNPTDISMSSNLPGIRAYVSALRYMTTRGGAIIMHGDTHQYNNGVSGDDFEFWNASSNEGTPVIPEDSATYVEDHLRDGLIRFFDVKVYPVAWETPHYAASMLDYSVIARHFSTAVEQRVLLNRPEFSQYFPFVIKRDIYGQQIFPENLGYVPLQMTDDAKEDVKAEEEEVDTLLRNARAVSVLRDVTVGAFIHPFINTSLVTRLAQGLQQRATPLSTCATKTIPSSLMICLSPPARWTAR